MGRYVSGVYVVDFFMVIAGCFDKYCPEIKRHHAGYREHTNAWPVWVSSKGKVNAIFSLVRVLYCCHTLPVMCRFFLYLRI